MIHQCLNSDTMFAVLPPQWIWNEAVKWSANFKVFTFHSGDLTKALDKPALCTNIDVCAWSPPFSPVQEVLVKLTIINTGIDLSTCIKVLWGQSLPDVWNPQTSLNAAFPPCDALQDLYCSRLQLLLVCWRSCIWKAWKACLNGLRSDVWPGRPLHIRTYYFFMDMYRVICTVKHCPISYD